MDIAAIARNLRKRDEVLEQSREIIGDQQIIGISPMGCDKFADNISKKREPLLIVNPRSVAQGEDQLRMATLEGDEEPLELSPRRVHEVMELVGEDERGFTGMEKVARAIDPQRRGALDHGNQLKAVMIVCADAFRLQRSGIRSLEEDDVIRGKRLLDPRSRKEARRRRQLSKMPLQLRQVFSRRFHGVWICQGMEGGRQCRLDALAEFGSFAASRRPQGLALGEFDIDLLEHSSVTFAVEIRLVLGELKERVE